MRFHQRLKQIFQRNLNNIFLSLIFIAILTSINFTGVYSDKHIISEENPDQLTGSFVLFLLENPITSSIITIGVLGFFTWLGNSIREQKNLVAKVPTLQNHITELEKKIVDLDSKHTAAHKKIDDTKDDMSKKLDEIKYDTAKLERDINQKIWNIVIDHKNGTGKFYTSTD